MEKFNNLARKQVLDSIESGGLIDVSMLPGKVKGLRKALGMTQLQMATRLGIWQSTYMRMEKNLDSSGVKTIERFLRELNCLLKLQIRPLEPFKTLISKRAYQKAKAMLDRTYGNMALEKQAPDKKTYEKRLRALADELASDPKPSLWED
jgi:transcriptional regulator with XRE-family HTH domain